MEGQREIARLRLVEQHKALEAVRLPIPALSENAGHMLTRLVAKS